MSESFIGNLSSGPQSSSAFFLRVHSLFSVASKNKPLYRTQDYQVKYWIVISRQEELERHLWLKTFTYRLQCSTHFEQRYTKLYAHTRQLVISCRRHHQHSHFLPRVSEKIQWLWFLPIYPTSFHLFIPYVFFHRLSVQVGWSILPPNFTHTPRCKPSRRISNLGKVLARVLL